MSWLAPPMPSSSPLPLQLSSTAKQKACCLISSWFSFALLRSPWAELISQLFFFMGNNFAALQEQIIAIRGIITDYGVLS